MAITDSVVVDRAIDHIFNICKPSFPDAENNKAMIGRNKGCDLIIDAMRRHADDINIFHHFVKCVVNLTLNNIRNRDLLVNLGYIELCIEHLSRHSLEGKNELAVSNACVSISNIIISELGKLRALSIPALIPLMENIAERYVGQVAMDKSKEVLSKITA